MYENRIIRFGIPIMLFALALLSIFGPANAVAAFSALTALLVITLIQANDGDDTEDPTQRLTDSKERESEIIPYDSWPDECFACSTEIDEDMEIRGQFVVHKGDSVAQTKAVALCEECTWTYSTLLDNSEYVTRIYDDREE